MIYSSMKMKIKNNNNSKYYQNHNILYRKKIKIKSSQIKRVKKRRVIRKMQKVHLIKQWKLKNKKIKKI